MSEELFHDVKQKVKDWYNSHIVSAIEKALKLIHFNPKPTDL